MIAVSEEYIIKLSNCFIIMYKKHVSSDLPHQSCLLFDIYF